MLVLRFSGLKPASNLPPDGAKIKKRRKEDEIPP
jgi:hypothetical protein